MMLTSLSCNALKGAKKNLQWTVNNKEVLASVELNVFEKGHSNCKASKFRGYD